MLKNFNVFTKFLDFRLKITNILNMFDYFEIFFYN
jgi:hypothetical protein